MHDSIDAISENDASNLTSELGAGRGVSMISYTDDANDEDMVVSLFNWAAPRGHLDMIGQPILVDNEGRAKFGVFVDFPNSKRYNVTVIAKNIGVRVSKYKVDRPQIPSGTLRLLKIWKVLVQRRAACTTSIAQCSVCSPEQAYVVPLIS